MECLKVALDEEMAVSALPDGQGGAEHVTLSTKEVW